VADDFVITPGTVVKPGKEHLLLDPCKDRSENLIKGKTHDSGSYAVEGLHCSNGMAVSGTSQGGTGVGGYGDKAGVYGESANGNGAAGKSETGAGVYGESRSGAGVLAKSRSHAGVWAESRTFEAIHAESHFRGGGTVAAYNLQEGDGFALYGNKAGDSGHAGFFEGAVWVRDNIGVGKDLEVFGNITVHGDISLTSADCTEDFEIVVDECAAMPGTVMVLADEGALRQSSSEYDRRVAGVISGAGDYKPAIKLDRRESGVARVPVAMIGKVFCKVDADFGAIEAGDLLTTSGSAGYAMKAADPSRAFGAVLGKALRAHGSGKGLIPILVTLQ